MLVAQSARQAANGLKTLSHDKRTAALKAMHDKVRDAKDAILAANKLDVEAAENNGLSPQIVKRLDLALPTKFDQILQGVLDVAALEDPVGKVTQRRILDDGLELTRVTAPLGVILVIFEARPEVMINIAALALKCGDVALLKGGKESQHTLKVLAECVKSALAKTGLPEDAVTLVASREEVTELLKCDEYIDLVIPRGSNQLVRSIKRSTSIPVLGHADGICSVYIHEDADADIAAKVVVDSKTNYPAACNSAETLLVHKNLAPACLKQVIAALLEANVEVRAYGNLFEAIEDLVGPDSQLVYASEQDFDHEFLNLTIAVKEVGSLEEAIAHINQHGSHHTDAIITKNSIAAAHFQKAVDSAGVYWNASTRFADGFRYGFGAEVGVSTNKLHARGPVGLEGLVTYQYLLAGHGHVAGEYIGGGGDKSFVHKDLI